MHCKPVRDGNDFLEHLLAARVVVRAEAPREIPVQHIDDRADRANPRRGELRLAERAVEHARAELPEQVRRRRDAGAFARGALVAERQIVPPCSRTQITSSPTRASWSRTSWCVPEHVR